MDAFDEEVVVECVDGSRRTISALEYVAGLQMRAAVRCLERYNAGERDRNPVGLDAVKDCMARLSPVLKQLVPFVVPDPQLHNPGALSFIAYLDQQAGGGEVTPDIVEQALLSHARGEILVEGITHGRPTESGQ